MLLVNEWKKAYILPNFSRGDFDTEVKVEMELEGYEARGIYFLDHSRILYIAEKGKCAVLDMHLDGRETAVLRLSARGTVWATTISNDQRFLAVSFSNGWGDTYQRELIWIEIGRCNDSYFLKEIDRFDLFETPSILSMCFINNPKVKRTFLFTAQYSIQERKLSCFYIDEEDGEMKILKGVLNLQGSSQLFGLSKFSESILYSISASGHLTQIKYD